MFCGERTRLHGNALNLCVVMDTLPHFLLASTPFWFHLAFPAVFLSFCSLFNTPYTQKPPSSSPEEEKARWTRESEVRYMVVFPGGWKEIRWCRGGHKTIAVRSCKLSGCQMYGSSWKIVFFLRYTACCIYWLILRKLRLEWARPSAHICGL